MITSSDPLLRWFASATNAARARAGLLVAQIVLERSRLPASVTAECEAAIQLARTLAAGQDGPGPDLSMASNLHAQIMSLADRASRAGTDLEIRVIGAVIGAAYFILWQTYIAADRAGMINIHALPNDLADIDETVLDQVCVYATQTALASSKDLLELISR
jgi:hypothetical protein